MDLRWRGFGALDAFQNRHNQTLQQNALSLHNNSILATYGSFHSVKGNVTRQLFQALTMPRATIDAAFASAKIEAVRYLRSKDYYWAATWACRVGAARQTPGVCSSPALAIPARLHPAEPSASDKILDTRQASNEGIQPMCTAVAIASAEELVSAAARAALAMRQIAGQGWCLFRAAEATYTASRLEPPQRASREANSSYHHPIESSLDPEGRYGGTNEGRAAPVDRVRNVVLVSMLASPDAFSALSLLVTSLRDAAGCGEEVVVFLPAPGTSCTDTDTSGEDSGGRDSNAKVMESVRRFREAAAGALANAGATGAGVGVDARLASAVGVSFWTVNCPALENRLQHELGRETNSTYTAWAAFLQRHRGRYRQVSRGRACVRRRYLMVLIFQRFSQIAPITCLGRLFAYRFLVCFASILACPADLVRCCINVAPHRSSLTSASPWCHFSLKQWPC